MPKKRSSSVFFIMLPLKRVRLVWSIDGEAKVYETNRMHLIPANWKVRKTGYYCDGLHVKSTGGNGIAIVNGVPSKELAKDIINSLSTLETL